MNNIPRWVLVLCTLWFLFSILAFSDVGSDLGAFLLSLLVVGLWLLVWLIRLIRALWLRHKVERPWLYWTIEPLVIVLCVFLSLANVFTYIRFQLSKPALLAYIEQVKTGKIQADNNNWHWVGLYSVHDTELMSDNAVRFITSSNGMMSDAGFVYSATHKMPEKLHEHDEYQAIDNNWWYWYRSW